jgi:hypothetical protein
LVVCFPQYRHIEQEQVSAALVPIDQGSAAIWTVDQISRSEIAMDNAQAPV